MEPKLFSVGAGPGLGMEEIVPPGEVWVVVLAGLETLKAGLN